MEHIDTNLSLWTEMAIVASDWSSALTARPLNNAFPGLHCATTWRESQSLTHRVHQMLREVVIIQHRPRRERNLISSIAPPFWGEDTT